MEVIKSPNFNKKTREPVAIAIGSFDGLHSGHQAIINKTINKARDLNIRSAVYSFVPHPMKIINPEYAPSSLISFNQKVEILEKIGVDFFYVQEFTPQFSKIKFEKFIDRIMINKLNVQHIVVGHDFNFGYRGTGNIDSLKEISQKYNFSVTVLAPVKIDGRRVSSSYIRKLIKMGKIDEISRYYGRNYQLEGKVIYGEGRGHKLGFPTANLKLATDYVLPPKGVYAAYIHYKKQKYRAIVNFGYNPTFSGETYSIEVHLMDFSGNLYGENLELELVKFIRGELAFDSSTDLVNQIKKDILYTENVL